MENNFSEIEFLSKHLHPVERQEEFLNQLNNVYSGEVKLEFEHYEYPADSGEKQKLFVLIPHYSKADFFKYFSDTAQKSFSDFVKEFAKENNYNDIYCYFLNIPDQTWFHHSPLKLPITLNKDNVLLISSGEVCTSWFERVVVLGLTKSGRIAPRCIGINYSKKTETNGGTLYEYDRGSLGKKFVFSFSA